MIQIRLILGEINVMVFEFHCASLDLSSPLLRIRKTGGKNNASSESLFQFCYCT